MNNIIEYKINPDFLSDNFEYFFTFLYDRFEYTVELWIKELEKKFNKKFKPVWILPVKQNNHYSKENYIIINKKLKELLSKNNHREIIYQQDYDDLIIEFIESDFIQELITKLVKKQGRVFILPFTSAHLDFDNVSVKVLSVNPRISLSFDDKTTHIKIFESLNIPTVKADVYKTIDEVRLIKEYPYYITATYSCAGMGSSIINSEKDIEIYYSNLREINKTKSFLVAEVIQDITSSPNVNAIVCGPDDTRILCITDQILRGNEYLGNIYPSEVSETEREIIIKSAKKVGNYLSNSGYRGLFGLDFLIDKNGKIYCMDLNPRRQGGYLCNVLMLRNLNIPEIELKLFLNEEIPYFNIEENNFINYSWAHGKIKPYTKNMIITGKLKEGEPSKPFENTGSAYKAIFYNEGSKIIFGSAGYLILSGKNNNEVKEKFIKEYEEILRKNFSNEIIEETHQKMSLQ